MSETSPVLNLPYIQPAQAQKHVTHNAALRLLDRIVQPVVADRDRTAPPGAPAEGDCHLVADGATGHWAGRDGAIAVFDGGAWGFVAPRAGWRVHVLAEGATLVFDPGTGWGAPSLGAGRADLMGVNAEADAVNRLAIAADSSLFSHDGADHRVKVNKAAPGDTASLLFQSGWSGRAEMGLAGTEDFAVKVSPDGSAWITALSVAGGTGAVDVAGLSVGGQGAYHRGNLLGTVAESGGAPAGAVLERGANADGEYVRLADGTQVCTSPVLSSGAVTTAEGALYRGGDVAWTYPAGFAAGSVPVVSGGCGDAGRWLSVAAPGAGSVTLRAFGAVSSATASDLRVMAVGRWF